MATGEKKKDLQQEKDSFSLKGTFISVMLLGVFLIVTWIGVYALFITR